jgi:hypothetical protein
MRAFHIHVDAMRGSSSFDELLNLGFGRSDFAGHPEGIQHYEPAMHMTYKTSSPLEFKSVFDKVVEYASADPIFLGYVEGEYIAIDRDILSRPFNPSIVEPFQFTTTKLPVGAFRETEIHITLDRDKSHPRLLHALHNMGFFAAFLPKAGQVAEILTVQGAREKIQALLPPLIEYLEKVGGAEKCSIKEEPVAKWWMSSPDVPLPPVIDLMRWKP